MAKRGNENHWPAGSPIGGQFAPKGVCGTVRGEKMNNDIDSYIDNEYFDSCNEPDQDKRVENINNALYDGGYILEKGDTLCGFNSAYEAEGFMINICSHKKETKAWEGNKKLVENYVEVAKGYISRGKFDWVKDGHRTKDGSERRAQELTDELRWGKEEVKQTILNCLTADDFVNSGKNTSYDKYNQGTVVMVFAPRMETKQYYYNEEGTRMVRRKVIDLYVKMVLNPHPNRERGQTEMQVISFREAERDDKICLYTGEVRHSREEWKQPKFKNHKDRPLTLSEMRGKK